MKNKFLGPLILVFIFVSIVFISGAQTTFTDSNLVVFYPDAYDAVQTQPSFAIQNEPVVQPGIPANWNVVPVFYKNSSSFNCAAINCGKNVDFYGTGEVTGNLRRNNTSITLWNTDNYGYTTDNGKRLYQSHPWVLGVRADGTAFGVIADNTWKMTLDISDTSIVFSSQGGPLFRVLVFVAPTPQDVIKKLADLTGKINLPPLWSLGYQQCRYSYMTDAEVKSIADNFRAKQLPCDVIWMDIDYMDQYKIFTFSPTSFPNPASLNTYLHNKNFKSVWMIDPGVKQQAGYSIYDQGTAGNHWVQNSSQATFVGTVWPGNCVFPDFTRPETRLWWSGLYSDFMATGIDGVWNDMNEPSVFNGVGGTMPATNIHRGGGGLPQDSHLRYHNVYGRLMVQASREGIIQANPAKRPFILSRSNFLGGQQYAATWTGDNQSTADHMQLSVPMILSLGLSGQPISGADVGGYKGNCTADLLSHWMALGTFYPFYRNHAEKGTARQEPWSFGAATEQVSRIALQRRYRLLPYIYSLTHESTMNGMPVMRPMFFADPKDPNLRNQQQAFLLGDILMVVPKWAIGVNIPAGSWKSISLVGEDSKYDPYQPNVLLKGGSILPLGQIIQSSTNYSPDSLTLIVSLDSNDLASGSIYSDSGEGYGYQSGQFLTREFNIKPYNKDSLILTATVTGGSLSAANNIYKVGLIIGDRILYTDWINSNEIIIPRYFTPFGGSIKNIPGKIETEDYDSGKEAGTYHDVDSLNQGGKYRNGGVDIETCSEGGFDVGWIVGGEWLTYSVNVLYPGIYSLQARVTTDVLGGKVFHVELDGVNISGTINVPYTGGWQNWQTVTVNTPYLTSGKKVLRIVMDTNDFNLNYLNFSLVTQESCPNVTIAFVAAIPVTGNKYQWQVNTGSGYTNMMISAAVRDTLILSNPPSSMYGNKYRCAVTYAGLTCYSQEYTLQFADTWKGTVNTAWENAANWSCGSLPDSNTDVIINQGVPNYPVINSHPSVRSITVNSGTSVTVNPAYSLEITH